MRNRAEYLEGIARLESRLGRVDEAIKAGRELLAATAAGSEQCEFFAQLCFQLVRGHQLHSRISSPSAATSEPAASTCRRSGEPSIRIGLVLLMWM